MNVECLKLPSSDFYYCHFHYCHFKLFSAKCSPRVKLKSVRIPREFSPRILLVEQRALTFSFRYRWQEIGRWSETADAGDASGGVGELRLAERGERAVERTIQGGQIFDHQIQGVHGGALELRRMHMSDGRAAAGLVGEPVERILTGLFAFAAL